jgi:hypothetical protein
MTSKYRPRNRYAHRAEASSSNIQVLTIHSPYINNQNILPPIQATTYEYLHTMDKFAFQENYNDMSVNENPLLNIMADFWH